MASAIVDIIAPKAIILPLKEVDQISGAVFISGGVLTWYDGTNYRGVTGQ